MNRTGNSASSPQFPSSPPFPNMGSSLSNNLMQYLLNNPYLPDIQKGLSTSDPSFLPSQSISDKFLPHIAGMLSPSSRNTPLLDGANGANGGKQAPDEASQEVLICNFVQNLLVQQLQKDNLREMLMNPPSAVFQSSQEHESLKQEETRHSWNDMPQIKEEEIGNIKTKKEEKQNSAKKNSSEKNSAEQNPTEQEGFWNEESDQILLALATQCRHDWKKISKKFANKVLTSNFLKQRYRKLRSNSLQKRIKFTHEEDLKLVELFSKHGADWTQFATHFQNRTGLMLKNRYYSHIRKPNVYETLLAEIQNNEKNAQEKEKESGEISNPQEKQPTPNNEIEEESEENKSVVNEPFEKITLTLCPKEGFSIGVPTFDSNSITIQIYKEKTQKEAQADASMSEEIQALKDRIKSLQQALYVSNKKNLKKQKSDNTSESIINIKAE